MSKELAQQALAIKALQEYYKPQRESLIEFTKYMLENALKRQFDDNWHYNDIADQLEAIERGEINRLIICQPPRSGKTMLATIMYALWRLGRDSKCQICVAGYSTTLTQNFSKEARDLYISEAYRRIFPEASKIRDDQNTKDHWALVSGGRYYATGAEGTITGMGFDLIILDDLLKANDAGSETVRKGVNNWYLNEME